MKIGYKVVHSDSEWRQILDPEAYHMLREEGTEPAFHNKYWDNERKGTYVCKGCGNELFSSTQKFESGTGWPSFWAPIRPDAVTTSLDTRFGMVRTAVKCAWCGGHLGHVFEDGPPPTGLRYCMNSGSMDFIEDKGE